MSQGNAVQLMNMMGARANGTDMSGQMAKLEESCKDFESVFAQKLLTVMRRTVPKNDMINGGKAEEIFTGMLDEEIAKSISEGNSLGLAKMIFEQLKQQILGNGAAQMTDPRFLQLGQELVRMEAEGGEPSAEQLMELLTPAVEEQPGMELPVDPEEVILPEAGTNGPGQADLLTAMEQANVQMPVAGDVPAGDVHPDVVMQEVMTGTDVMAEGMPESPAARMSGNGQMPDGMEPVTGEEADELAEMVKNMSETPDARHMAKAGREGLQTAEGESVPVSDDPESSVARAFEGKLERVTGERTSSDAKETPDLKLEKAAEQKIAAGAPVAETESPEAEVKQVTRRMAEQYQTAGQPEEKVGFARRIQRNLTGTEGTDAAGAEDGDERSIDLLKNAELFNIRVKDQAAAKTQAAPDMGDLAASFEPGSRQEETAKPAFNLIAENMNARMARMEMIDKTAQTEQVQYQTLEAEDAAKVIDQIVKKAQVLLKTGHSEMKIELEPKHLGEVRIRVVMENDSLTAKIHAKSDAVGEVIRTNLGQLGDTLKDMGFDVSNFDVSTGDDNAHSGRSGHTDQDGQEYSFADVMEENLEEADAVQETGARLAGAYAAGGLSTVDLRI